MSEALLSSFPFTDTSSSSKLFNTSYGSVSAPSKGSQITRSASRSILVAFVWGSSYDGALSVAVPSNGTNVTISSTWAPGTSAQSVLQARISGSSLIIENSGTLNFNNLTVYYVMCY